MFDDAFNTRIQQYEPNHLGKTDIQEDGESYLIHIDAPGFNKKDFDISVDTKNVVTIHGKKTEQKNEQQTNDDKKDENKKDNKNMRKYVLKERTSQEFTRSFQLPEQLKRDEVQAQYVDGVLMIHIPKMVKEQDKISKIEVQ